MTSASQAINTLGRNAQTIGLSADEAGILQALQQVQSIVMPGTQPIPSLQQMTPEYLAALEGAITAYKADTPFRNLRDLVRNGLDSRVISSKSAVARLEARRQWDGDDINTSVRNLITHSLNDDAAGKAAYKDLPNNIKSNIEAAVTLLDNADRPGGFVDNLAVIQAAAASLGPQAQPGSSPMGGVQHPMQTGAQPPAGGMVLPTLPTISDAPEEEDNTEFFAALAETTNTTARPAIEGLPVASADGTSAGGNDGATGESRPPPDPTNPAFALELVEDFLKKFAIMARVEMAGAAQQGMPEPIELLGMLTPGGGAGELVKKFLRAQQGVVMPNGDNLDASLQSALPLLLGELELDGQKLSDKYAANPHIYTPQMGADMQAAWPAYLRKQQNEIDVQLATPGITEEFASQLNAKKEELEVFGRSVGDLITALNTLATTPNPDNDNKPYLSQERVHTDAASPIGKLLLNLKNSSWGAAIFQMLASLFSMITNGDDLNKYLPGAGVPGGGAGGADAPFGPGGGNGTPAPGSSGGTGLNISIAHRQQYEQHFLDAMERHNGDIDAVQRSVQAGAALIGRIPGALNAQQRTQMQVVIEDAFAEARRELDNGSELDTAARAYARRLIEIRQNPHELDEDALDSIGRGRGDGGNNPREGAHTGPAPSRSAEQAIEGHQNTVDMLHENTTDASINGRRNRDEIEPSHDNPVVPAPLDERSTLISEDDFTPETQQGAPQEAQAPAEGTGAPEAIVDDVERPEGLTTTFEEEATTPPVDARRDFGDAAPNPDSDEPSFERTREEFVAEGREAHGDAAGILPAVETQGSDLEPGVRPEQQQR